MTGQEMKDARAQLEMTQQELAAALGLNDRDQAAPAVIQLDINAAVVFSRDNNTENDNEVRRKRFLEQADRSVHRKEREARLRRPVFGRSVGCATY
jgi:transcriptional regulator with XRE-family HTH domain